LAGRSHQVLNNRNGPRRGAHDDTRGFDPETKQQVVPCFLHALPRQPIIVDPGGSRCPAFKLTNSPTSMWISTRSWTRWSALILASWSCVLLASLSASASQRPGGTENKSGISEQYQAATQQRPTSNQQVRPAPPNQQIDRAERRYRQEMLRLASEQTRAAERQAAAAERQAQIYGWLLWAAIGEGVLLVGTLSFTGLSAIAAKQSADALINAERPHLLIQGTPTIVITGRGVGDRRFETTFLLKNYGKSPAWITGQRIRFEAVTVLPANPPSDNILPLEGAYVVPPGETREIRRGLDPHGGLSFREFNDVRGGTLHVFLYGFIDYTDTSGSSHRSRFAWQCIPNGDVLSPDPFPARAYWEYT